MPKKIAFDVIAIAASAGGLKALESVLAGLPNDLECRSLSFSISTRATVAWIAKILSRHTGLTVKQAENEEVLQSGHIYIAPPNQHLLVNGNHSLSLTQTELVHFAVGRPVV